MAAQNNQTDHNDESQDENLQKPERIHHIHSHIGRKGMHQGDQDDHGNGNTALLPFGNGLPSRKDNIGGKDCAARG